MTEPELLGIESWPEDQLDPDNWMQIPEFGVNPGDVDFVGFVYPIVCPARQERFDLALQIRELVRHVRTLARRHFTSLTELKHSHREAFQIVLNDSAPPATEKHRVAVLYQHVMWSLEAALCDSSSKAWLLASASVALLNYVTGRRDFATKRAQKARHAENHAMRQQLRVWYEANRTAYRTLDAACEAATEIVPIQRSTAKTWLREFRKQSSMH